MKQAIKTAKLSVISNSFLIIAKLITGIIIGSISLISEAMHSMIDLIASVITFFAIKESSKPADNDHPYGHGKFENISGTVEALLIFIAAIYIIYEAIGRLINPAAINTPIIGVIVMFVASTVNFFVSARLFKVAKRTGSIALEADAWHLRTDVYTSIGVMIALAIITIVKFLGSDINIDWLDPVAALLIATMIIKTAYQLTKKSAKDLTDVKLPDEEIAIVENIIRTNKFISGYHDVKTRKAGNERFVEFHILMPPNMSVLESHNITRQLESMIKQKLQETSVTIHVEPCDNTCTPKCQKGCLTKYCKIENNV